MARRLGPRPSPRGLLFLLAMAVGFGVLAGLLSHGAADAPAVPTGGGLSYYDSGAFWFALLGYLSFAIFFGYVAFEVYRRVRDGRMPVPAMWAVSMLTVLLLGVAAVYVLQWAGRSGGGFLGGGPPHPTNNTTGTSGPPPALHNNSSVGLPSGPVPGIPELSWAWIGLLGLLAAAVIAALVLFRLRNAPEDEPEGDRAAERMREELAASLRRLEDDPSADPREIILALYHRLLLRVRSRLGPLGQYTPREIEQVIVAYYGAQAAHAQELRELFEVARYSTHPLGRPEAERARAALRGLLADLDGWAERERERREREAARAQMPPPAP